MAHETPNWPFVPAKWFTPVTDGRRSVMYLVIHDMEWARSVRTAEDCGREFQATKVKKSAHIGVDTDSIVQYVKDNNVAYACPGLNHNGIHIELAGFQRQTLAEWEDRDGRLILERAAEAAAHYTLKYPLITPWHLTDEELHRGLKGGIVGHDQGSRVFKISDHTDPGPNFPWTHFTQMVQEQRRRIERGA